MDLKFLSQSRLFKGIDRNDIPEIFQILQYQSKIYNKNEYIYYYGENITELSIILSGEVIIEQNDKNGSRNIISTITSGQVFAEAYAFAPDSKIMVNVIAAEKSEILFLNILASFKFKISRATLGFSNTQITSLTNYQRIIRHHFNLYENKPWLMLLHSRGGYGTMVIIDIGLTGEINTSGTRYTITGQFVSGDTIYSDDGIISMTHGGTTTTNFNDIHKVRIPDNGEYTFITYSSTAYMRPSFVVQTKSGSILHLDIKQINDTDISGYFTTGMTINDEKITRTGFQTLQNIITNNRLIISL